jgi:hypothetical protein
MSVTDQPQVTPVLFGFVGTRTCGGSSSNALLPKHFGALSSLLPV